MRSISSCDRRPLSEVMVMSFLAPEALSAADTERMPFASTSKDTSICGTPRGAGGMPPSSNLPRARLSFVMARSPSKTWMSTPGWLSAYVENVCDLEAGMVVPRSMSLVMTPPAVSMPMDRGATSRRSTSFVASPVAPERMPAWTAAPYATASSGLMDLQGSLPLKKSARSDWILGMRVEPPTSTTSFTWLLESLASRMTFSTGSMHLRK
mmetsp:Transcript_3651/g.10779  ORF Transcript_3651/g.10779 Transcript_3651/m.10779 type:complete len:210 (+) Transcript_3651:484-1113(+)